MLGLGLRPLALRGHARREAAPEPEPTGAHTARLLAYTESTGDTVQMLDLDAWETDSTTTPAVLATIAGGNLRHVAFDPQTSDLYVAAYGLDKIVHLAYQGGDPLSAASYAESDFLAGADPYGVAWGDDGGVSTLFYSLRTAEDIYKAPLGTAVPDFLVGDGWTGLIVEGDTLFYASRGTWVRERLLDGSSPNSFMNVSNYSYGVASDGTYIYGCDVPNGRAYRRTADGSKLQEEFLPVGAFDTPQQIAASSTHLYVSDNVTQTVERVEIATKAKEVVISGAGAARGCALHLPAQ